MKGAVFSMLVETTAVRAAEPRAVVGASTLRGEHMRKRTIALLAAGIVLIASCDDPDEGPTRGAMGEEAAPDVPGHAVREKPLLVPKDSDEIKAVAFRAGNNGPAPILLFAGGFACTSMDFVLQEESAAAQRQKFPADWVEWSDTSAGTAIRDVGGATEWKLLANDEQYAPLPRGAVLSGTFRSSIGIGGVIGKQMRYRFAADGSFESCDTDAVVGLGVTRSEHSGTYAIDGYVIHLDYGTRNVGENCPSSAKCLRVPDSTPDQDFTFVYDPARPLSLWLHGTDLKLQGSSTSGGAICD